MQTRTIGIAKMLPYQWTPTGYGIPPKCRFDADRLEVRYLGTDQAAARPRIAEYP